MKLCQSPGTCGQKNVGLYCEIVPTFHINPFSEHLDSISPESLDVVTRVSFGGGGDASSCLDLPPTYIVKEKKQMYRLFALLLRLWDEVVELDFLQWEYWQLVFNHS